MLDTCENHINLGLLVSLLELREDRWSLQFDEETGNFGEDEVSVLINNVCTS